MKIKFKGLELKNIKKLKILKSKKDQKVKQEIIETEKTQELPQQTEEEIIEESEEQPVKEYRETLYSVGHTPEKKLDSLQKHEKSYSFKRREDFTSIEENIDDIGKERKIHNSSDINKKVDLLISKKKK